MTGEGGFVFCFLWARTKGTAFSALHYVFQLTVYDTCANVSGFHHFSAAVLISGKGCPGYQTEGFLCCI